MTNMPFEKTKKDFCTFCLWNLNVEKDFVTCCGAEEVSSAFFYICLLRWNQTHPGSAQKKVERSEPEAWKDPTPTNQPSVAPAF